MKKLKERWNIDSNQQIILILSVFAITGSTAAYISKPIMTFINLNKENTSAFMYWPFRILILFPIYQILLVFVGWLFGQFSFFWEFEKKMLSRLRLNIIINWVEKRISNK